jgi:hypothetical protein
MVSRVADRLDVAYFATLDDARKWLARPSVEVEAASVDGTNGAPTGLPVSITKLG